MPDDRTLQTNLSGGELSPEVLARTDLKVRSAGLKQALNMLPLPQGGAKKRPGTLYIGVIPNAGDPFRMASFEFSPTQSYVLIFTDEKLEIWRAAGNSDGEDVLEQTLELVDGAVWPDTVLDDIWWCQSHDTMIVTHPSYAPRRIIRDTTKALGSRFSIEDLSDVGNEIHLTNIPNFDYKDASSPTQVNEVQRITFSATGWSETDRFQLALQGVRTRNIIYANDPLQLAQRIQAALRELTPLSIDGVTVVNFSATQYDVTFGGDDGNKDWELIEVFYVDPMAGSIVVTELTPGASTQEPVWSSAPQSRGWPKTCAFHDGRLVFGGSASRPATLWASQSNDFYNFDAGDGLDGEAIIATIDRGGKIQSIIGISSGDRLEIFTASSEFVPGGDEFTPQGIVAGGFNMVSDVGALEVPPVRIDGATVFVDGANRALHEFLYSGDSQAYIEVEVSILAAHLVRSPVDMTVVKDSLGDYLWIANADGTMTSLNRKRAHNLSGMTPHTTQGTVERLVASNRTLYLGVTRTINGTPTRYLERMSDSVLTDCAVVLTDTDQDTWTGLSHLEGCTVEAKLDGVCEGEKLVALGTIVTSAPGDELEVGFGYLPVLQPPPPSPGGSRLRPRRISRWWLSLQDSGDVYVNGYRIDDRYLHADAFDEPPALLNGSVDGRARGWSREPTITITQKRPMPLTVLGIGMELGLT